MWQCLLVGDLETVGRHFSCLRLDHRPYLQREGLSTLKAYPELALLIVVIEFGQQKQGEGELTLRILPNDFDAGGLKRDAERCTDA